MLFEFLRPLTCPFYEIERFVPKEGRILDVGCGHGVFSRILGRNSRQRQIQGIDPSEIKITAARKGQTLTNVTYQTLYLDQVAGEKYDVITVIDVMYLLPVDIKARMLKKCSELMTTNGKLFLVVSGKDSKFWYMLSLLEEWLMTKVIKFTHTDTERLHFLGREDYRQLLAEAGFKVELEKDIRSFIPYPHILFIASPIC